MQTTTLAVLTTFAAFGGGPALADSFTEGDVYLLCNWPGLQSAVARVDPVSGDATVIHDFGEYVLNGHITYEPWRDRLIVRSHPSLGTFVLLDADGTSTDLPGPSGVASWAPTGDGRIYMISSNGPVYYLDADDQPHTLYDIDGVTPFCHLYVATGREDLIYDAITNSLFFAYYGDATQLLKIPLSADGTRLAAPAQTVEFDAVPDWPDEPQGLSAGPGGEIFIKIRTSTDDAELLMFTVDPETLAFEPFAYIQHFFSSWNAAGTYNSTHGLAYALDHWNGHVRTYVESAVVQEGAILASGVSDGAGFQVGMTSIGDSVNGLAPPPPACGDTDGDGQVNVADLLAVLTAWGPCGGCPEDFDGDGVVNVADLLFVLTTWGAC